MRERGEKMDGREGEGTEGRGRGEGKDGRGVLEDAWSLLELGSPFVPVTGSVNYPCVLIESA